MIDHLARLNHQHCQPDQRDQAGSVLLLIGTTIERATLEDHACGLGSNRRWIFCEKVTRSSGGVVRIRHGTCGRTGRTDSRISTLFECTLFIPSQMMSGKTSKSSLWLLACTILTGIVLTCTIATRLFTLSTASVLADFALGFMSVWPIAIHEKKPIHNRATARQTSERTNDKATENTFHLSFVPCGSREKI